MANQIGSIDDLLTSGKTHTQPATPEHAPEEEQIEEAEQELEASASIEEEPEQEEVKEEKTAADFDDYGNERAKPKVYTEDEVNERINSAVRDRLARAERNHPQPNQQQVQQQAQQGFEYNENSSESWQQQLESFVEQTVSRMSQKQAQQAYQAKEHQTQAEFETKFKDGMTKFADYHSVVGVQPITDAMVIATRSMKDPAAFIYAASKRAPKELERISRISDHYTQIAEMAKLEERMKQTKPTTKAPRPIEKTHGDVEIAHKSDKKPSIEEMIAKDAARRLAVQKQRRR